MPLIHVHVVEGSLDPEQQRRLIEATTRAAVEAEGVPVTELTWVLIHEIKATGWGAAGVVGSRDRLPIVEIHTPERWVTLARKKKLIRDVGRAVAGAAGLPGVHYVVVHDVADGGWGWQGQQVTRAQYEPRAAPDLPITDAR